MPSALERENARCFEVQHFALRVEKEIEFRRQLELRHGHAFRFELSSCSLDRTDGGRLGVSPCGCPAQADARRRGWIERTRAGAVPGERAHDQRTIVDAASEEADGVETVGERLHA